ncbi:MAG: ABC transporter permease [Lachnospiraceae bacterium]|nr:ABC transporter permease [Lachnospiraceae bacterium]
MQSIINLLTRAVFMSTPLILGALGEVIAERTGMMMCAVEGIFLSGAWGGFVGAYLSGNMFVGFLSAMLCGMLVALLYGFCTVYLGQHQIVMGTAVAILMTGFCTFFYRIVFGTPTSPLKVNPLPVLRIPVLSKIPVIGQVIFSQNIISYLTYLLVPCVFYLLYKTALGLTIRSCGENPEAVEVAGINVRRIRFLAVGAAGILGGIAGAYYSLCNVGMYNSEIISGRGWIAFGICFLGNWNPVGALLFGIIFGISDAIGIYIKALGVSGIPSELFSALPYFLVIVLTAMKKQFNVPAKLGVNYIKED